MKKILITALAALLLFLKPVAAQGPAVSGWIIFNVPGEPCQQQLKTQTWSSQYNLHITDVEIWNGLDDQTAADVQESVIRSSDGSTLIWGNHDDYTNGGSVRVQKMHFAPAHFDLAAGDSLVFQYSCTWGVHGAWVVIIWVY